MEVLFRQHPHAVLRAYMAYAPHGWKGIWAAMVRPDPVVYTGSVISVDESKTRIAVHPAPTDNIWPGMTMWVHDEESIGATRGKVRVKGVSTAESVIVVAENDGIRWDGARVTVLRHFELWSVHPRLLEDGTILKDYDIAYVDQNQKEPPKANIRIERCIYLVRSDSDVVEISLFGGDSFPVAPGASIASHQWFVNGQATGSGIWSPPIRLYPDRGLGCHWISLRVTDSNGKVGFHHTPIWVLRYPESTSGPSALLLSGLRVRWSVERGWEAELSLQDLPGDLVAGATVAVQADLIYGNDIAEGRLLFWGFILENGIQFDHEADRWTVRCVSPDGWMRNMIAFPTILMAKDNPRSWVEISRPATMKRAVYHVLKWHTTACEVIPFQPMPIFMDRTFPRVEDQQAVAIQGDTVGAQIDELVNTRGILARWGCGINGELRFWQSPDLVPDAQRPIFLIPVNLEDYVEESEIITMGVEQVGWVRLGGVSDGGVHLSWAPGNTPGQGGRIIQYDSLWVTGQEELNNLAGLLYARENAGRTLRLRMAGAYLLDPARFQWFLVRLPRWRDEVFAFAREREPWEMRAVLEEVEWTWEREGHIQANWTLREVAPWVPGETRPVPPPSGIPWDDWQPPPIGEIPPPSAGQAWWWVYVFMPPRSLLARSRDIRRLNPDWQIIAQSGEGGITGSFADFCLDPLDPGTGFLLTNQGLWMSSNLRDNTPVWRRVFSMTDIQTAIGTRMGDPSMLKIQPLTRRPGSFVVAFRTLFPDINQDGVVFVWTSNRWGSWTVGAFPAMAPMDPKYIIELDEQFEKDGVVFLSTRPWYTYYNPNYNLYECPFGGRPRFIRNLNIGWEIAPVFLATHPKNPGQILIGHTGNFVHQWSNTVDLYVYEGSGSTLARQYSFNPYLAFRLQGAQDEFNYRRGVAAHPAVSGRYGFIAWALRHSGGELEPVAAVFDAGSGIMRTIPLADYIPRDIAGGQFALHLGDSTSGILYVPTWSPSALYVLMVDRETLIVNNVLAAVNMPSPTAGTRSSAYVHPDWTV